MRSLSVYYTHSSEEEDTTHHVKPHRGGALWSRDKKQGLWEANFVVTKG